MAEFKMPKYVYKNKPISLDECYQKLAALNYQSPVNIVYQGLQSKFEGDIYQAIQSYGVHVDKDELIKALQYDRDQYKKGFADGCIDRTGALKKEIAREILEEIEIKVRRALPKRPVVIGERSLGNSFELGKEKALLAILAIIADLEKKYTEEQI